MNQQAGQAELAAEQRAVLGKKVKHLREQGIVPGVLYGNDIESMSLQFDEHDLIDFLSRVGGSQLISISIEDHDGPEMALLRDSQRDPITGQILHVDFYRVNMEERLTTEIPLTTIGESPVDVAHSGILLQGVQAIEVECLPGDLVNEIEIDLSTLTEVGQGIYVRDLDVPPAIDVLTDSEEMVARLVPLAEEEAIEELLQVEEEEEILIAEGEEIEVLGEVEEGELEGEELEEEEIAEEAE